MSDPIDDKALDEYLKGGSLVSQRYREIGADEVPDDLSRRVLDQARAAVAKRPAKSRAWMRWSAPVALAASAVLVLSIVIDSGVQQGEMLSAPAPAAAPSGAGAAAERESADVYIDPSIGTRQQEIPMYAPSAPIAQSADETPEPPSAGAAARLMMEKKKESAGVLDRIHKSTSASHAVTPSAPPPPAPIAAASEARAEPKLEDQVTATQQITSATAEQAHAPVYDSVEEAVVTGMRRADQSVRNAGPRDTVRIRSPQAAAEADADEPRAYSDPEHWLEDIRKLRKDGEADEADREWERFRAAFPDYPVADSDLARKR